MTLQEYAYANPLITLLITLLVGFILGWLLTGLPKNSKITRAEADASDLRSKLNQANKSVSEAQAQERQLQAKLDAANASQTEVNDKVTELQTALGAAQTTLDDATAQAETLQDAQAELERLSAENELLKAGLEGAARDLESTRLELETVQGTIASKDTALTEAYSRAVKLERLTTDEQGEILSLRAEVATLKRNAATLTATNQELDARLQRARGEVAGELAALTSTMLRVKDDELAEANATINALQAQLVEFSGRAVSNQAG